MAAQNFRQAKALSQLDSLGSAKANFDSGDMLSIAEKSIGSFIERVKGNIEKADMIVTGGIDDIKIETTDTGINVLANPWLLYQDRGVNGSQKKLYSTPHEYTTLMPPAFVFEDYIKRKNLQLRNNENYKGKPHDAKVSPHADIDGDEAAIKSASFAMAKKIYKEGFKPQPVFAKEILELVEDLKKVYTGFAIEHITSGIRDKDGNDVWNKGK